MKKIKILSFASLPLAMALLAGCGHEHTFSSEWTTSAEKHWHDATCEHKDQRKDEGPHVDDDKNNKCDVCGYEMGTPTPTPTGGEVSEDEWVAAFGLSKPFYLADNYKLTLSTTFGSESKSGDLIVDGTKLKTLDVGGSENDAIYNEKADGKKYEYSYESDSKKWVKTEVRETAADDLAEFFLPFGQNYKLFAFDAESKSYKCATITCEGVPFSDLVIKFENKQIKELSLKGPNGDGGGVASVVISIVYGGQVVELPQAEEHKHSYVDKFDEYGHWKQCSCGEQEPGSMGAHYDANWDLKCDVCGYDMPVEVEPGYYIHYVNGSDGYASLEEISGKFVFESFYFDADLQFVVYQVTKTEYKAFSLLTLSEDDDTKNSGISLSDGVVSINEPGSKTLTFDPAGNEGKGVLSAKKDEGPEPGSPVYGYKLNSAEYVQMIFESKNNQWEAYDIEMKANDTLTIADINGSLLEPIVYSLLQIGGETQGFLILEGVLTAGKDGVYSFYVDAVNDVVYIAENSSPIPEVDCKLMGSFDGWTDGYKMTLKEGTTEYVVENVTVESAQSIKVKFGDDYIDEFKTTGGENNAFVAGVCKVDSGNAFFNLNAVVNVYFESNQSGNYGVFIELKEVISPYKGEAFVGDKSVGELTFKFNKIDSSYVEYSLLNAPTAPGIEYELQFSNGSPINIRNVEEGGEGEKFTIVGTRLVYSGTKTALDFYLKDYGADYDVYVEAHVEPVTYNTLYLNPGEWANDGATFYAYFFDSTGTNTAIWVALTLEDSLYKVDKVEGYDKVIFVRCDPTKDPLVDDWGAKWNQTDDLDVPTDANVKCTITGWGEPGGNSTCIWETK